MTEKKRRLGTRAMDSNYVSVPQYPPRVCGREILSLKCSRRRLACPASWESQAVLPPLTWLCKLRRGNGDHDHDGAIVIIIIIIICNKSQSSGLRLPRWNCIVFLAACCCLCQYLPARTTLIINCCRGLLLSAFVSSICAVPAISALKNCDAALLLASTPAPPSAATQPAPLGVAAQSLGHNLSFSHLHSHIHSIICLFACKQTETVRYTRQA